MAGIAPATVKGVRDLPLSTIKSSAPLLAHPFKKYGGLDEKQFHYAFANTLSQEESDRIRERYAVPGPAEVLKEGAFANFMRHAAMSVTPRTPTGRPCSSSPSRKTTWSREADPAHGREVHRLYPSSTRSFPAARTSRASPDGRKSPTTR